ncbi:VOC family protein [Hyphomonas sp.]|uniref:VOC family protein n=1 Tax=Hyphomonas sp. TaxID=87 RepID=UPI003528FB2E
MTNLAYIVLNSEELDDWVEFARTVGADASKTDGEIQVRVDDCAHRILIRKAEHSDIACLGFEFDDAKAYAGAIKSMTSSGFEVTEGSPELCKARAVKALSSVQDPEGLTVELVHGLRKSSVPPTPNLKFGFAADETGFGHALLKVKDLDAYCEFYAKLGATLSDHIVLDGEGPKAKIAFLHFNPRHHTLALMQGEMGSARKLQHFMLEMKDICDVGRTFDRLSASRFGVATTLGQHTNDRSISFYCRTPAQIWMEIGCHGVHIEDESAWQPATYDATSEWGHKLVPQT